MTDAPAPAAAATTLTCNVNFLTSPAGILKIVEVVLGLIAWACAAASPEANIRDSRVAFTLFAFLICWLIALITMGIYLTGMHATVCSGVPWAIFETIFNSIAFFLYFIGACVIASAASAYAAGGFIIYGSAYYAGPYGAAAAFGFFTAIAYALHFVFYFKKWRGVYPWEGCGTSTGGGAVQT